MCESDALNNLAICADYAGDSARAHSLYEASLAIARDGSSATIATHGNSGMSDERSALRMIRMTE